MARTVFGELSIAGVPLTLELPDEPFARELLDAWTPFRAPGAGGWKLEATLAPVDHGPITEPRELPRVADAPGGFSVQGPDFEAMFDRSQRRLRLLQRPGRFPVETLVKVLVADRLSEEGGVLVHGVGLASSGQACAFVGVSGAGKSTLGALAVDGGLLRLSDELVAIVPTADGGYEVRGTPWNVGAPGAGRLRLLGRLAWGEPPRLQPTAGAELLRLVLNNSMLVRETAEARARQFRALSTVIAAVPTAELVFPRDTRVAELLRRALVPPRP